MHESVIYPGPIVENFAEPVIRSSSFKAVMELCQQVADSQSTIFIAGESGTGKELVARAIHRMSARRDRPFVAINCSAIPEFLLESEFFGHSKGSFTGAHVDRSGVINDADGGTLFLDEVCDLSLSLQPKLLRFLQDREIRRVGENRCRRIDVRVIAATNKDVPLEVKEKRFRQDLFFRLNVIPIHIAPLRERQEDILPLAELFMKRYAELNRRPVNRLSEQTKELLLRHQWNGNVRELENMIERAVILAPGDEVSSEHLLIDDMVWKRETFIDSARPMKWQRTESQAGSSEVRPLREIVEEYILYALKENHNVLHLTAKALGLDRKTLYRKLKDLDRRQSGVMHH